MSNIISEELRNYLPDDGRDESLVENESSGDWPEDAWGAEAPLPLHTTLSEIIEYPTDCLGELAEIVTALATGLQVAESLAAQSILSAVSTAAQNHASVQTHLGAICPLNLFMLTVADPGSRKEVLDRIVFSEIKEQEKLLAILTDKEISRIKSAGDKISDQEAANMFARCTYIIDNAPLDFVAASVSTSSNSLIYLGDGITQFVGTLSVKSKTSNAHGHHLGKLWENSSIQIKNGRKPIFSQNCNLSLSLSVQSDVGDQIIDPKVFRSSQNVLSKFIITHPKNLVGTRLDVGFDPVSVPELAKFNSRLARLMTKHPVVYGSEVKSPPIRLLKIDDDAKCAFIKYVSYVERQSADLGPYQSISSFTSRSSEHILKLASLMAIYENPDVTSLNQDLIIRAMYLFDYYACEYMRVAENCNKTEQLSKAQKVLAWLEKQATETMCGTFKYRDVLQRIHLEFRTKAELDKYLKILEEHNWIRLFANKKFIQLRSKPGIRYVPNPLSRLS